MAGCRAFSRHGYRKHYRGTQPWHNPAKGAASEPLRLRRYLASRATAEGLRRRPKETTHDVHRDEPQLQGRRLSRQNPCPVGRLRLRLRRQQPVAASRLVGCARRHQELCRNLLRSGRTHRQRVLALGGDQHSAQRDRACTRRRQSEIAEAAAWRTTDPHRLRRAGLRRPLPAAYLFTVFAVGVDSLSATADTSAAVIGFQLNFNTLAKAAIMGLFKR